MENMLFPDEDGATHPWSNPSSWARSTTFTRVWTLSLAMIDAK